MKEEVVHVPEESRKLTFPISLKQPGLKDGTIKCFIRRNLTTQTSSLYIGVTEDGARPSMKVSTYRRRLGFNFEVTQEEVSSQPLTSLCRNKSSEFSCLIKEAKQLRVEEAEAQCALLNFASLCGRVAMSFAKKWKAQGKSLVLVGSHWSDYGQWTAFLALLVRPIFVIPGKAIKRFLVRNIVKQAAVRDVKRLVCMMVMFSLSCTQRFITVSHVQFMLTLSEFNLVRTGGTMILPSVSGAGMMARGQDKVAHYELGVLVAQVHHLLLLPAL